MTKTVYLRLWALDKEGYRKYICLVKNKPEDIPGGHYKDWGWGMVGGGQKAQDLKDHGREAREIVGGFKISDEHLHEIATALKELRQEAGLNPDKIKTIDPKSRKSEIRKSKKGGEDHEVVVYDAFYYTHDISAGLRPDITEEQIVEARWIDCADLMNGTVDGLKIYRSHLRILNDEPNPHAH